jgi:recombination protein RecT
MDKELILQKSTAFPHVFRLLPITEGKPIEPGTWGAYPFDSIMILWINSSHTEAIKYYSEYFKNKEQQKMSKELTIQEDNQIKNMLKCNIQAIKSVLPKHLTPERAMRIAYTSLVKNPMLARCSQVSLMNAIIESSMLGLELGGPLGQASLIPFKNGKTGGYEATLVVEYKGMITLANNTGNVKEISAHPVFEKDEFRFNYGLSPDLYHIPSQNVDSGDITHAYAIIKYVNGGIDFEVIGKKTAMEAKDRSAAKFKKDSPWNKKEDEPAMWVKTAIRRLMNRVPKSADIRQKMDAEERSGQEMNHIIDISLDDFHAVKIPDQIEEKKEPVKKAEKKAEPEQKKDPEPEKELSKEVRQALALCRQFPAEFNQACAELKINFSVNDFDDQIAIKVCKMVGQILDSENS